MGAFSMCGMSGLPRGVQLGTHLDKQVEEFDLEATRFHEPGCSQCFLPNVSVFLREISRLLPPTMSRHPDRCRLVMPAHFRRVVSIPSSHWANSLPIQSLDAIVFETPARYVWPSARKSKKVRLRICGYCWWFESSFGKLPKFRTVQDLIWKCGFCSYNSYFDCTLSIMAMP